MRVLLVLAGLAAVPQFTVRDRRGNVVARVDPAFPQARIAIEYDGAWHAAPGQFTRDRRRLNRLVAAGWTVLHVTAADLRTPDGMFAHIRALLARVSVGNSGSEAAVENRLPHSWAPAWTRRGQSPKSWVHHGPPGPSATPTPSVRSSQSRMFARWPLLSIQSSMTAAGSGWP